MIVDELVAILGYEVKGQDKLRSFTQSIDDAARRLATFAIAAGTVAAAAAAALGKSVISTTAKFESFQATLETVEEALKGPCILDWISDFAKKTPYEVEELTSAFVKLRAYGMDPTNGLMEDLGNASSAMGKRLIDAVEMIADASTGEFERLKEFGIRASQAGDQVTFSWTENGKTLTKTTKKTGEEITKFIQERFGQRFSGAMIRQSKTWNGMVSNLSDTWTDFLRRIGEAGFFDAVKGQLGRAINFLNQLDMDGTLDRWAKSLSSAFVWVTDAIAGFGWRMAAHWGTLAELIEEHKGAWEWLKGILLAIAIRLWPVGAAFFAVGLLVDDFLGYLRGGQSVIGDFIDALAEFLGAEPEKVAEVLGKIATAAGGLLAGAIALGFFASSVRSLATALGLIGGASAAKGAAAIGAVGKKAGGRGFGFGTALSLFNAWDMIAGVPDSKDGVENLIKSNQRRNAAFNTKHDKSSWLPKNWFGSDANAGHPYMQGNGDGGRAASLDAFLNFKGNMAKMGGAAATVVNDSSDRSINVKATATVSVNEVNQAASAAGREVENAVRNAINNSGSARASRFEKDDAF